MNVVNLPSRYEKTHHILTARARAYHLAMSALYYGYVMDDKQTARELLEAIIANRFENKWITIPALLATAVKNCNIQKTVDCLMEKTK